MASRKMLLSFGLIVTIVGLGMVALSLQSLFASGHYNYAEYFRAFGLGIIALGLPLTIGSLSVFTNQSAAVTKQFEISHLAFIQVFVGSFLALFLAFFDQMPGLLMKVLLLVGSLLGAFAISMAVFGILKVKSIRRGVLNFLDWITMVKD